jgi:aspartate kinase
MGLRVFKFGGTSVMSADGVRNLAKIVSAHNGSLVIVMSAMGKTTNAFELVLSGYMNQDKSYLSDFQNIKENHIKIAKSLLPDKDFTRCRLAELFQQVEKLLSMPPKGNYNFCYDQIVSYGELLSSSIISAYLSSLGVKNSWVDIRRALRTDNNYREGNVDYKISEELCKNEFQFDPNSNDIFITQGFIGGAEDGNTTTLGREGSDYTAALLANLLNAESVTIWKDVEGVLNADPRLFQSTIKLDEVSFKEAIELAYCGAQIIHPKTIKPIQNKQISLFVKSFLNPEAKGTLVYQTDRKIEYPPIFILKKGQVLISLTPRDFSFVIEDCLSKIFATLYKHRVKANLIQSSAISFSICVDNEEHFLPGALHELGLDFSVKYNKNLELLTIRHYTDSVVDEKTQGREVLLQQKTRSTIRVVVRSED